MLLTKFKQKTKPLNAQIIKTAMRKMLQVESIDQNSLFKKF